MRLRPLFRPRNRAKAKSKLRHKGKQSVEHSTVNGVVKLKRIYWWSADSGRDDTIDQLIGIVADRVSVGVRQMCCRVAISQQGFDKAAEHLQHLAQIRISKERRRTRGESEGQLALKIQRKGLLAAGFSIEDCKTSPKGPKRVYIGTDGVKIAMVTESEKNKRRKVRGAKRAGSKRRCINSGADKDDKKVKRAKKNSGNEQKRAGDDGEDWIDNQLQSKLTMLDCQILDFYHLSEHIWAAANTCFNQGSGQAKEFESEIVGIQDYDGTTVVLTRLGGNETSTTESTNKR